jgi:glycosyltransferase involved in cell wall biosynthesis
MKTKQPSISIIVPIWNTAQYLDRCLSSLINQTKKDVEIVCVNDGSSDNSLEIVKKFASRDSRIKIINQKNKGVATARNVGLKNATSKYIMWCDSDDEFALNMCEKMFNAIEKQKVDMVVCAINVINDKVSNKLVGDIEDYVSLKFSGKQSVNWNLIVHTDVSLPSKIMRKSLIDKYNISFPAGLHFEDAYFFDQYFTASKNVYYLDEKLYNYHRNNDSIMSRSFKKTKVSLDYIQIIPKTYAYLKKNGLLDKYNDFFWHRFIQYYAFSYDNAPVGKKLFVYNWGKSFIQQHKKDLISTEKHIVRDLYVLVSPLRSGKMLSKKLAKKFLSPRAYGLVKRVANKVRNR